MISLIEEVINKMKKRLHEILVPLAYYYYGIGLGVVLVWSLISIETVKVAWILLMFPAFIFVFLIAISRFLDERYLTLYRMKPEEITKK